MTGVVSLRRELTFDSFILLLFFVVDLLHFYGSEAFICTFYTNTHTQRKRKSERARQRASESEVFRLRSVLLCGISCDKMVSLVSTVTHCGLAFSQSIHSFRHCLLNEGVLCTRVLHTGPLSLSTCTPYSIYSTFSISQLSWLLPLCLSVYL